MRSFDLGSPLGIIEYGYGADSDKGGSATPVSETDYAAWATETMRGVSAECGSQAIGSTAEYVDPICFEDGTT